MKAVPILPNLEIFLDKENNYIVKKNSNYLYGFYNFVELIASYIKE